MPRKKSKVSKLGKSVKQANSKKKLWRACMLLSGPVEGILFVLFGVFGMLSYFGLAGTSLLNWPLLSAAAFLAMGLLMMSGFWRRG